MSFDNVKNVDLPRLTSKKGRFQSKEEINSQMFRSLFFFFFFSFFWGGRGAGSGTIALNNYLNISRAVRLKLFGFIAGIKTSTLSLSVIFDNIMFDVKRFPDDFIRYGQP